MEIEWEVGDGYVGKGSPQSSIIDDDEIIDQGTIEDAMEYIEDWVQADFDNNISWYFIGNVEGMVRELFESKSEDDDE